MNVGTRALPYDAAMPDVTSLFDWLVDGAPGETTSAGVFGRFCDQLAASGVPLQRGQAFVRTLHPNVMGRRFRWVPGEEVVVNEASYATLHTPDFLASPIREVFRTGKSYRRRGDFGAVLQLAELAEQGITDYLVLPLRFLDKTTHAVSFATRVPNGFDDDSIAAIEKVTRPLARVAEILALTRTAANVLNTYVGRNAGEQILSGKIQRGDTQAIQAAIWFSDLRGYTELSGSLPPAEVIRLLNDLFDCQVPAIEKHGGEVLKFIGDGLLAIFPFEGANRTHGATADAALQAAVEAYEALTTLNPQRQERGVAPIRFGLGLHVGEVAYGNIGGATRLDFTCIGQAVNLASRLEGLTGKHDRRVVVSRDFARLTSWPTESLGKFQLKGVAEEQDVLVPARAELR